MYKPSPHLNPPPIDMEQALAALEGNAQLLTVLVKMVIDQAGIDIASARNDAAANNSVALAASSHRLKGSLGAIAAYPAYRACSALNLLARMHATESFAMGLAHLEEELGRLLPCLQAWLNGDKNLGIEHGTS